MRSTFPALAFLFLVDLLVLSLVVQPMLTRLMRRYYELAVLFGNMSAYMR